MNRAASKLCWALAMIVLAGGAFTVNGLAQSQSSLDVPAAQPDVESSLPATDLSLERTHSSVRAWLDQGGRAPGNFQSASLPLNPLAPDATSVGSKMCVSCHAVEQTQFAHTLHARAFKAGALGGPGDNTCETCHGAGSAHAANPAEAGAIIRFTSGSKTPVSVQTGTCLNCHAAGAREHWLGSVHEARGLSCSDCHNPMARTSPEGLLSKRSINEVCSTCHQDVRAKFNRRSHMPLTEGQMSCVDCHNPHGSLTRPLLKTDTVNATCYSCHAEKRGPFLFEHAPVRGSCLNCHDPHGSNQQTLLAMPMPMLCQQCHTMTRHPNDLQTRVGLGNGPAGAADERLIGRSCLTCHANVHGSNNPSGARHHK
jgi:DmsE family decaheme c-type cytochrome